MNQSIFNYPKIIYVTPNNICKPTAMANRTITIVNALNEKGINIEIACLAILNPQDRIPIDINPGISVKYYAKKIRLEFVAHLISLIKFFYEIIQKKNVTIYIYGYYGIFEIYFLFIKLFKRFYTIREICEYPGYNKKLNSFEEKLLKWVLDKSNLIVVINHALEDYVKQFTQSPVVIMNMTVDYNRFDKLIPKKGNIITYCGEMTESKDGLFNLIKAFARFQENVNETYKLRLIGDDSNEKLMTSLLDLCKSEKIDNLVEFTGNVDRNEIPFLLSESKMLVLCRPKSRQATGGFPTKLGEYLATGIPVVVTNVGEISDFVYDGINGFLAESNDPEHFALKMVEVVKDYDRAIKIGIKGKELAKTAFSAKIETNKLLPFLKQIV